LEILARFILSQRYSVIQGRRWLEEFRQWSERRVLQR
jgi:hypothetical protein